MTTVPEAPDVLKRRIERERRARAEAEAIAERTTAELYKVAERQRAILESAGDAILATDSDQHVVLWNPAAASLLGLSAEGIQGAPLHELLHPVARMDPPCIVERCPLLVACTQGHSQLNEETIVHRGTGPFPAGYTFTPIAQHGRPAGWVLTLRDVSARKQAEAARIKMAAQLDEMNRLKEIDVFRTNFINMAAHELRTPLTPIRTELYLLKQTMDSMTEDQGRSVEILNRSFERLGRLVEEVLEGARMQAGKLGIRREPLDLTHVVKEVVDSFVNTCTQRRIRLDVHLEPSMPLMGDAGRLGQVVGNLVGNAVKFTPADGAISIRAKRSSDLATVSVRDTGVGLERPDLEKLFRPFSQVTSHSKAAQDGAGLGLYICKGIVELHGGRIWAESPGRDRGSSFTFALPVGGSPTAAPTQPTTKVVGERAHG